MRKTSSGDIIFSPSDLIRYLGSPFASWMDRYHCEFPNQLTPDAVTPDQQLIFDSGLKHEQAVLKQFQDAGMDIATINEGSFTASHAATLEALAASRQLIYQAALKRDRFQGHADFVELGANGSYLVWDTKLARSPKPYYIIQLCAYSEMIEEATGTLPGSFGVILGSQERAEFRLQDFIHYFRRVRRSFLAMQDAFTGNLADRPEPMPRADHGQWTSHAEAFFEESDHVVRVAGIMLGQIKKLKSAGITTMTQLAHAVGARVPKLAPDTLTRLANQARLQMATIEQRKLDPNSKPVFEVLPSELPDGRANGLARLPAPHPADVFFDMEGYPLVAAGLEYLFGLVTRADAGGEYEFQDWWAHDRHQERQALEGFVDYVYARWQRNPGMHIYHYAPYEVSAVRRLSTRHDTRQDEVDTMLRNNVFVDLYQTVRQSIMLGEDSYSIKRVEHLYRGKRETGVATAVDSIVQYAAYIASGQPQDQFASPILKGIRDYNEDDCVSTAELRDWLLDVAQRHGLARSVPAPAAAEDAEEPPLTVNQLANLERAELAQKLRAMSGPVPQTLADLLDYHRREDKPKFWRMFDRAEATEDELRDDPACVAGLRAVGAAEVDSKGGVVQAYRFDPSQELKLKGDENVQFAHDLSVRGKLAEFDSRTGFLKLRLGKAAEGSVAVPPAGGSVMIDEYINQKPLVDSLVDSGMAVAVGDPPATAVAALLERTVPAVPLQQSHETELDAAKRVTVTMSGGCLVIQGPPGTGKTYTASRAIAQLLAAGKRVGITSNSHKAILNLMAACGDAMRESGADLNGLKVGGSKDESVFAANPNLKFEASSGKALGKFNGGVVGGTAWLFSRPEWVGQLDFLFIDEAGQVPLANAVAVARSASNVVLLGDQMQLEQPIQGTHPGNAGMSVLQYALMDLEASRPDAPVFYPVIPPTKGLFLGTSRRMHPTVCSFISESIYEGRLLAHDDCARQSVAVRQQRHVAINHGIAFSPVVHEGNIQRSDEEVERVVEVFEELLGSPYTDKSGTSRRLELGDFLFIAPYNAQVRAMQDRLPEGAKVGSVDRFQGQEAPVCILSLCSSAGEYGSRGLAFILDKNRVNVAISRAQCLAVVVADSRIADSLPGSIEEMGLLNLFCRAVGE